MADDFDPLMNPEPERAAPPQKSSAASVTAPRASSANVPIDAPAPKFAPPRPPPAKNVFDNLDDEDDGLNLPAPAPSPAKLAAASRTPALFVDDEDDDPLVSRPAAPPKPKIVAPAPVKSVDAASSNASQFTGVSKRGSTLFKDGDADVLSGGASDIFIPSEARGLETGIDPSISVEALDDSLLRVDDDDIDSLFVDQPTAAAPARKDRLGLTAPQPAVVGNRNASVTSLFGPKAKVSASSAAAATHVDDDDDLFGDIGGNSSADNAMSAMSELNFQDYIAKQKSRCGRCLEPPPPLARAPLTRCAAAPPAAFSTDSSVRVEHGALSIAHLGASNTAASSHGQAEMTSFGSAVALLRRRCVKQIAPCMTTFHFYICASVFEYGTRF